MLEANLKAQLGSYLQRIHQPVEIVASLDDTPASAQLQALLRDIADASPLLKVTEARGGPHRTPSFSVNRPGEATGPRALTVTDITPVKGFYDYEAKYAPGGSIHKLPAELPAPAFEAALRQAERAHAALGCRGVSRSDFRYDDLNDVLVLLEVNTQPGMTSTSLAPEQAAHVGIGYRDLVRWMVEDASCPR